MLWGADPTDVISGGAGWTAVTILVAVLWWLMFKHLPAKDVQLKELIQGKDEQVKQLLADKDAQINAILVQKWEAIKAMSNDHRDALKTLATEFRSVNEELARHCEAEITRLLAVVHAPNLPNPPSGD